MTEPHPDSLPSVEEILGGQTQGGVPRPAILRDDADDGSVMRVGSSPVFNQATPKISQPLSRWDAVKALLRIIFGRS